METKIILKCPQCHNTNIVKNGKKINKKQNYLCKDCKRQFVGDHNLTYNGCHSGINNLVKIMLVRGNSIRDIATILEISTFKVLSVLANLSYEIVPKQKHYSALEVDEFWTYVGNKSNKL